MVVTCFPATLEIAVMQERVAAPLMCTVQAPQSAMPQPNFVPVLLSVSRSTQSKGMSGLTSTDSGLPFKVKLMAMEPSLLQMDILQQLGAWMKIRGKPIRLRTRHQRGRARHSRRQDRGFQGIRRPGMPGREQGQLPATGAGSRGALRAGGASDSTPRQPTGRPLTASFTERNSTTYINWR